MTATQPVFKVGKAWTCAIVNVLGSIGFGLGLYKAMTTYSLIIVYFQIDASVYGIATTVSLASLATAIPGGMLLSKTGAALLSKICVLCCCVGNILPTIYLLVCGRASSWAVMCILGIPSMLGWGAISIAGTALISAWFPPQKRSFPMGVAGTFASLSMLAVQFLSTPLINLASTEGYTEEELAMTYGQSPAGIVTVTVAFTIYVCVVTVVACLVLRDPSPENSFLGVNAATEETGGGQQGFNEGSWLDAIKNGGVWLILIVYMCYTWASTTFATYWPTYIADDTAQGGFNVAATTATMYTTAVTYSMIVVSIVIGFLLTKVKRDYWWILILIVVCGITFNNTFLFNIPSTAWFVPYLVIYGCTAELFPCIECTLMPEITESPKALGFALGLVMTVVSIIGTVCGVLNGFIISAQGIMNLEPTGTWNALGIPLRITAVFAFVAGIALVFWWRKHWAKQKAAAAAYAASLNAQA